MSEIGGAAPFRPSQVPVPPSKSMWALASSGRGRGCGLLSFNRDKTRLLFSNGLMSSWLFVLFPPFVRSSRWQLEARHRVRVRPGGLDPSFWSAAVSVPFCFHELPTSMPSSLEGWTRRHHTVR
ncbi:hypothetical protein S40288_10740 [Stachybotrys chartarum IBT 40288]|nr:hypothetical protein S40288_10740 [Stachybotrys chartarum IBT 40288]